MQKINLIETQRLFLYVYIVGKDIMKEIERKFLVKSTIFDVLKYLEPQKITQGYVATQDGITVRVRTKGTKGFLTVKGKTIGLSRDEYEYEIPYDEALEMTRKFCTKTIEKDRYELQLNEKKWEIDIFQGHLEGLILAEIELSSEDEVIELPAWVGEDVSLDTRYYNSNLIQNGI